MSNPDWVSQLSEGDWVTATINDSDMVIDIKPNPELTKERQGTIQDKLSLLKSRKKSKFLNE